MFEMLANADHPNTSTDTSSAAATTRVGAFAATDGDLEHIDPDAYEDGLPSFAAGFDAELEEDGAPTPSVTWCARWESQGVADLRFAGTYRIIPIGHISSTPLVNALANDESVPRGDEQAKWPVSLRLCIREERPPLADCAALPAARSDTVFIQPMLIPDECATVRAEIDAVVKRVGWVDDGTGIKLQTRLRGHENACEQFSATVRSIVQKAVDAAIPLAEKLMGCGAAGSGGKTLSVRGQSVALIRYGSAPIVSAGATDTNKLQQLSAEQDPLLPDKLVHTFKMPEKGVAWRLLEPQPPRLEVHIDGSTGVTVNVLLSEPSAFTAGGTYIEAKTDGTEGFVIRPGCGHALLHHRAMRHAGFPIVAGLRHVLVIFLE